jgi:hypothetical protein
MEGWHDGAGESDEGLLDSIRETFEAADPMPLDLPERIRFALALCELEAEVARATASGEGSTLAARGAEESWTVTFDSESLTIMIRVDANPDGTARVDGWLAPPQPHRVEMRRTDSSVSVTADQLGRFVFHNVSRGMARLIIHPPEPAGTNAGHNGSFGGGKPVITPALTL